MLLRKPIFISLKINKQVPINTFSYLLTVITGVHQLQGTTKNNATRKFFGNYCVTDTDTMKDSRSNNFPLTKPTQNFTDTYAHTKVQHTENPYVEKSPPCKISTRTNDQKMNVFRRIF